MSRKVLLWAKYRWLLICLVVVLAISAFYKLARYGYLGCTTKGGVCRLICPLEKLSGKNWLLVEITDNRGVSLWTPNVPVWDRAPSIHSNRPLTYNLEDHPPIGLEDAVAEVTQCPGLSHPCEWYVKLINQSSSAPGVISFGIFHRLSVRSGFWVGVGMNAGPEYRRFGKDWSKKYETILSHASKYQITENELRIYGGDMVLVYEGRPEYRSDTDPSIYSDYLRRHDDKGLRHYLDRLTKRKEYLNDRSRSSSSRP